MEELMIADMDKKELSAFGRKIRFSCNVRNELNGLRKLTEKPLLSLPAGKPVMPRTFPLGEWNVEAPRARTDDARRPFFIPTNAFRMLPIWTVVDGHYGTPTEKFTKDIGYGMHFSVYENTEGCLKILSVDDLLFLVDSINKCFREKTSIKLKVI